MIRRLSIMGKMIAAVMITGVVLVVIGFVGVSYVNKMGDLLLQTNSSEIAALETMANAKEAAAQFRAATAQAVLADDAVAVQNYSKEAASADQDFRSNLNEYKRIQMGADHKQIADNLVAAWDAYSASVKESLNLAAQNQQAGAKANLAGASSKYQDLSALIEGVIAEDEAQVKALSSQSSQAVNQTRMGFLLFVVVGGIIALSLGVILSRSITKPLKEMAESSELISEGNLTTFVEEINTNDEMGSLSKSFNLMVNNLTHVLKEIASSSKKITNATQQLNTGITQISQSAEQIAATAQQVAVGSEGQVRSVGDVTSAINQMSAGVQQIASNAQSVSSSAQQASEFADFGRDAIEKAIKQMDSIRTTVDNSAVVIRSLGEKSLAIGDIVDLIRNIADQTNLLALNAAIEAARAGEQGRGFAVVADEVRKLAEQSATATKDIADLIESVKDETSRAVQAMDLGTKEAAQGTVVVSEAGNAFGDILKAIAGVSKQIDEVSVASQEMASGSNQVVKAIETIAYIAQETSGQTQNVAAAAEEQTASMEEIRNSVLALTKMSGELDKIVHRFQLEG